MTPVKLQISKFKAERSYQEDFHVLQRFYSGAFVQQIKSFVHVSISCVCNIFPDDIARGLFELNLMYVSSVLNVDDTIVAYYR
jgi:hypothetical protein